MNVRQSLKNGQTGTALSIERLKNENAFTYSSLALLSIALGFPWAMPR